ncbi:uncharacterized protein METZ01_LOCUS403391, partial [marine metagenome]
YLIEFDYITSLVSGEGDTDNALFTIETNQLKTAATFNFEEKSEYAIRVKGTDLGGQSVEKSLTIAVTNSGPVIVTNGGGDTALVKMDISNTAVTTVTAATGDEGDVLAYGITGGADQALFAIDVSTGALNFINTPNFTDPADADADNNYYVEVTASLVSAPTLKDAQMIKVVVTGQNLAPTDVTLDHATIAENRVEGTVVGNLFLVDPDGEVEESGITTEGLGEKIWEFETDGVVNSSPAVGANGTVYVGSHGNKVYALHGATGVKLWEFQTKGLVFSSPAV